MSNVYLDDSTLTGIANAIRAKTGGSASITPANMATEIGTISGGGGVTQPLVMSEIKPYVPPEGVDGFSSVTPSLDLVIDMVNMQYQGFQGNSYNGNQYPFTVCGITKTLRGLYGNNYQNIINSVTLLIEESRSDTNPHVGVGSALAYIITRVEDKNFFNNKMKIKFKGYILADGNFPMIKYNPTLVTLDNDHFITEDFSTAGSLMGNFWNELFVDCKSLTTLGSNFKTMLNSVARSAITNQLVPIFVNCYSFKDSEFFNALTKTMVTNCMQSSYSWGVFNYSTSQYMPGIDSLQIPKRLCTDSRPIAVSVGSLAGGGLKHITFEQYTQEEMASNNYMFANVNFTMRYGGGYFPNDAISFLDSTKRITNASTYEALKNDPDAWTTDKNFSYYNHDSAVETINSLPDMTYNKNTGSSTQTFTFNRLSGSSTDEGAVGNLTEAEIAVGTAKGWTITFFG